MSVAGHQPPPFFKRGPAPLARLTFFVIVSLVLLGVDLRYRYLEAARQIVAVIAYPVQRVSATPLDFLRGVEHYFSSLAAAQNENARLRQRQVEAAGVLLRHNQLEQENQQLRRLLDMKERQPAQGTVAEVLYAARDPFSRKVIIDKGGHHGIAAGQPVVDDVGVIGQVTRVFPLMSEVTLITDKNQAVPVQIVRNGLRSVVFGAGDGVLELRYLAANADVRPGDALVTSGLDGIYLPGLPVARVAEVRRDNVYSFARIVCEPAGGAEQHGLVLILGKRETPPPPPEEQADAKDKPARGKKAKP